MSPLPPLDGVLDPVVAPLVLALRRDGFPTLHSCDGHVLTDGKPWVTIRRRSGFSMAWLREALIAWCWRHQIKANVCVVYSTERDGRFPFLRIEVFSDLSEASL